MKVAIYSRKSRLTDRGESIKNQIELCQDYILSNFNISKEDIDIYEDEGFSAKNTDRPEFQKLLKDIKRKKFDAIICYRLDRISRSVVDFSSILETLNKYNTSFISVSEHFDTSTPMGRAMMYIASVFAQLERETIAERIKDNMQRLARTGRYIGSTPPTGFKSKKIDYIDSNGNKKKKHHLVQIPTEIEFIELLFNKFYEFDSLSRLETWLMQNQIKNKNGNYIGTSEIRRILTNPVYVKASGEVYDYFLSIGSEVVNERTEFNGINGMLLYGRHDRTNSVYNPKNWTVVIAQHDGIIDSDKWIEIQKMLEKNKIKAPRAGKSINGLLTSKIVCKNCGGTMVLTYGNNKERHYYKCRNKIKSRSTLCNIKNIIGLDADNEILDYLKTLSENKSIAREMIRNQKNNNIDVDNKSLELTKNNVIKSITEKEKDIKNLTLQLRKNENSTAVKYIISDIETLDSELQALNKTLKEIENKKIQIEDLMIEEDLLINNIMDLGKNIENLSFDEKRNYINKIVDKITWDGVNMTLFFK